MVDARLGDDEHAVAAVHTGHVILRTSWVYSPFGGNFVKTMLALGETRNEVAVVADQRGSPTNALDIADAILAIARRMLLAPDDLALRGVFHMTGSGDTTWADFAEAIFAERERQGGKPVRINRIATIDYPTPARRPANSRLACNKLATTHGVQLPDWQGSFQACVARLLRNQGKDQQR